MDDDIMEEADRFAEDLEMEGSVSLANTSTTSTSTSTQGAVNGKLHFPQDFSLNDQFSLSFFYT